MRQVRTKIIATVGPACREPHVLRDLIDVGVDCFRVNMAHGDRSEHEQVVADIRQVSHEAGRPIGILIDLAGPKIRLGKLHIEPTDCEEGSEFHFIRGSGSSRADELVSNYDSLVDELEVGNRVLLADGTVSMIVISSTSEAASRRPSPGTRGGRHR